MRETPYSGHKGFTLVELLIAMTILSLMVVLTASLLSSVSQAWISGQQQVETFQDGRAILNLIARDLSQAVISPRLQFIQNSGNLNGLLTAPASQVGNSEGLFWQSVSTSDALGNVNEVGYYLTQRTDATGLQHFELQRFFVPPADPYQPRGNPPVANPAYHIYDSPSPVYYNSTSTTILPPWLNLAGRTLDPTGTRTDFEYASSTVSDGIVGLWIRCLDRNGDPIPWLSQADPNAAPITFNSKAYFQPAIAGQASSFRYTNVGSTAQGNQLPKAVEITIITVDSRVFQRRPSVPGIPPYPSPDAIPASISQMNRDLITKNIRSAHTFSTRIHLPNRSNN